MQQHFFNYQIWHIECTSQQSKHTLCIMVYVS